jgi:predicted aspartyl protease
MSPRVRSLFVTASLLFAVACGSAEGRGRPPAASRSGTKTATTTRTATTKTRTRTTIEAAAVPSAPKRVALRFELFGRAFPLPLVHGTVGGEPTWMLVDTGANSHVIAAWLARKAKLGSKNLGDVGTDHTGRAIVTSRVDDPRIVVEGWGALAGGPALVTEVPDAVARLGIGAFLSPQQLATAGDAIVLDLARAEMRSDSLPAALKALDGRGVDLFTTEAHACEDRESPIKGLAFVVPARIDGTRVGLLLDTGAHHSDLLTSSPLGRKLAPRSVANTEQVYAAGGRITTRTIKGAKLEVGAWSGVGDVDLLPGEPDESCPRDGALAMDVLQKCVLVLHASKLRARCGT